MTLERGGATLVVKNVQARVCSNCGEEYLDERTTTQLLKVAEEAARVGVQIDVREYIAAEAWPGCPSRGVHFTRDLAHCKAWLFRILRNRLLSSERKRRTRPELVMVEAVGATTGGTVS